MKRVSLAAVALTALFATACKSGAELRGDRAYKAGDRDSAKREYEDALKNEKLMDFEFRRIQQKWRRTSNERAAGPYEALKAQEARDPAVHLKEVIEFRRQCRDEKVGRDFAAEIDAYVHALSVALPPAPVRPDQVSSRLSALMDLRNAAVTLSAGDEVIAAAEEAAKKTVTVGFPAVTASSSFSQVSELIALREEMRQKNAPAEVDPALQAALDRPVAAGFAPVAPDQAFGRFSDAVSLRDRGRAMGISSAVDAWFDRVMSDAATHLVALAEKDATASRFVPAVERMQKVAAPFPDGHTVRKQMQDLLDRAAAFHRQKAQEYAANPAAALLHLALVRAFAGELVVYTTARNGLSDRFTTELAIHPRIEGCPRFAPQLSKQIASSRGTPIDLGIQLVCDAPVRVSDETRYVNYTTEEAYTVTVQVQVGTRREQVQVGSHQVQCSKPSSLEGYTWTGLCTVPDYEWKTFPVYEDRQETRFRDVEKSLSYVLRTHTHDARVSGTASLRWEGGEPLTVPISASAQPSYQEYGYQIPPRYISKPSAPTSKVQAIPADFKPERTLSSVVSDAGSKLVPATYATVRSYRARMARAKGAAAEAASDAAGAEAAYVLSILLNQEATDEAARWLETRWSISKPLAEALLAPNGTSLGMPTSNVVPVAATYTATPVHSSQDDFMQSTEGLEKTITRDMVSTVNYRRGSERFRTNFHLITLDMRDMPQNENRIAELAGYEVRGSLFASIINKPGWGPVIFDELGGTAGVGAYVGKRAAYLDEWGSPDEYEPRYGLLFRADYSLMPGIRTHYVALFAGANAGLFYGKSGHAVSKGMHLEPAARLGLRFWGPGQIILTAWGFQTIPGAPRSDGVSLAVPFGRNYTDLLFSAERLHLPTRYKDSYENTVELGEKEVWQMSVSFGIRG